MVRPIRQILGLFYLCFRFGLKEDLPYEWACVYPAKIMNG